MTYMMKNFSCTSGGNEDVARTMKVPVQGGIFIQISELVANCCDDHSRIAKDATDGNDNEENHRWKSSGNDSIIGKHRRISQKRPVIVGDSALGDLSRPEQAICLQVVNRDACHLPLYFREKLKNSKGRELWVRWIAWSH